MVVLNLLIFNVAKTAKEIIKCHSSVCKMLEGFRQTMHEEDDSDDEVEYEDSDGLEEGLPEEKICGIRSCV